MLRKSIAIALAALLGAGALPGHAQGAVGWRWPVRGPVITAYRNSTDPYAAGQHRGIDIAAPTGTPVVAATDGRVRYAGRVGVSGLVVAIRTGDGRFDTSYLHLSTISVRGGQPVESGQRLGAVGTTGRRSTARPHLHFGVRVAGSRHGYRDPLDFLPPLARPVPRSPRGAPAPVAVPVARLAAPDSIRTAPRGEPARMPLPSPAGAPVLEPVSAHILRGSPRLGPAPRPWPAPTRARLPSHLGPVLRSPHRRGLDPGWLLLSLGLLLAGGVMGATPGARQGTIRGGARVKAALRPLLELGR